MIILFFSSLYISMFSLYFVFSKKKTENNAPRIKHKWIVGWLEKLIEESMLRTFISYNVLFHLMMSVGCFFMSYSYMNKYMGMAVTVSFSVMGACIPTIMLSVIKDVNKNKMNLKIGKFMLMFSNTMYTTDNIFDAFDKVSTHIDEPLASYLKILSKEKKLLDYNTALMNLKKRVDNEQFGIFIDNIRFIYHNGGSVVDLTDDMSDEVLQMNKMIQTQNAEDFYMKLSLYFLIMINFFIIFSKLKEYGMVWETSALLQGVLIIDFIICVLVMYIAMKE